LKNKIAEKNLILKKNFEKIFKKNLREKIWENLILKIEKKYFKKICIF